MVQQIKMTKLTFQALGLSLRRKIIFAIVFCLLFHQSPLKTVSLLKFDRNISDRPAYHCCFQGWHPIWQIQTDQPFKTRNLLWMVMMYIYHWFLSEPVVHILRIKNTLGKGVVINYRGVGGLARNFFLKTSFMWFTHNTWPTQFLGKKWRDPPSLSKGMIP